MCTVWAVGMGVCTLQAMFYVGRRRGDILKRGSNGKHSWKQGYPPTVYNLTPIFRDSQLISSKGVDNFKFKI